MTLLSLIGSGDKEIPFISVEEASFLIRLGLRERKRFSNFVFVPGIISSDNPR
jgi:hypothetical protein